MKIALIQQRASADLLSNLERGEERVRQAAAAGAGLIVFPELSFLPFFPQKRRIGAEDCWSEPVPGPTTDRFCRLAAECKVVVVVNLYERTPGGLFDSSPVIDADGRILGVTRMIHIMEGPCFHEQDYYTPGDRGAPVFDTSAGRLGVAICYDRHFPEYMRALALKGAELVVVPQAGAVGEWNPDIIEAELQVASFQNGYFTALANRVGDEECLSFAGASFVSDPDGRIIARAEAAVEQILYAEIDYRKLEDCAARKHFLSDRRPDILL